MLPRRRRGTAMGTVWFQALSMADAERLAASYLDE
jgi:hypothetical protein